MSHVEHVRSYYEALNSGDAEAIGSYAALGVESIDAQWFIENAIERTIPATPGTEESQA